MPRFFFEHFPTETSVGQEISLPDAVFHHAVRVQRLKSGDACILFDGNGSAWSATLTSIDKRRAFARIENKLPTPTPSPFTVTLALAVTAAERMDWALQKGTELGASSFLLFYSERSHAQLNETRQERRSEHWRSVIISACEQCGQNRLPQLSPPETFDGALRMAEAHSVSAAPDQNFPSPTCGRGCPKGAGEGKKFGVPALRFFLDANASQTLSEALRSTQIPPPPKQAFLMIGPEGGFTADEIRAAQTAGWQTVRLGPRTLRAETAAAAALTLVQAAFGDLEAC
ncbi:MAG: 16S rRNA (uracil(1498)-N(3))-methyltransferase [Burkholderiales bacterium]|jgi:16S rRNA (uracil1498-N3)-methyltransferase|nr:16S rRNA (uracil(1498)-N(3))-methyltransferase [Burkholderiales bacterium]